MHRLMLESRLQRDVQHKAATVLQCAWRSFKKSKKRRKMGMLSDPLLSKSENKCNDHVGVSIENEQFGKKILKKFFKKNFF